MHKRAHLVMPSTYWNIGHRRSATNMHRYWPGLGRETHLHCHQASRGIRALWPGEIHAVTPTVLPDPALDLLARRVPRAWFDRRQRATLLRHARPGEVAVCWPGTPRETIRALRAAGVTVACEFINTHCQYSYDILAQAYGRLGLTYEGRITAQAVAEDDMRIREADLLFCPSAFVEESVREAGARLGLGAGEVAAKIVPTARGTFLRADRAPRTGPVGEGFAYVFAGEFGVRKGCADIVRAMARAAREDPGIRLLVAGRVKDDFRPWLEREGLPENVELLGFVQDMDALYARADALLFPSLEEGSPKVSYEAAAHGLPRVVTQVGGGRIETEGPEGRAGYLVPPSDPDALTRAVLHLARDATEDGGAAYAAMSRRALEEAARFSWEAISRDRHARLAKRGL
jgi:glycosyltransferase involved in cell wall biosynthesis